MLEETLVARVFAHLARMAELRQAREGALAAYNAADAAYQAEAMRGPNQDLVLAYTLLKDAGLIKEPVG